MNTYDLKASSNMYPYTKLDTMKGLKEVLYSSKPLIVNVVSPIIPQSYVAAQAIVDLRAELGHETSVYQDGEEWTESLFKPRNFIFRFLDKLKYRNTQHTKLPVARKPFVAIDVRIDMRGRLILNDAKTVFSVEEFKERHWKPRSLNSTAIPTNLRTFLSRQDVLYIANEKGNVKRWKVVFEERSK